MNKYLTDFFTQQHNISDASILAANQGSELLCEKVRVHNPVISAFSLLYFSTLTGKEALGSTDSLLDKHPLRKAGAYILALFYLPAWALGQSWVFVGVERGTNYPTLDRVRNAIAFTGLALFYPVALTRHMHQANNLSGGSQLVPGLLSLGARGALVYGFMSNHLMQDALQRLVHFNFQGPIGQVLPAVLILWATASLVLNDAMQIKIGLERAYREFPGFMKLCDRTVLALINPAYVFHKKPEAARDQGEDQGEDQGADQGADEGTCCDVWNRAAAIVLPTAALAGVGYALSQSDMMHQMVQGHDFLHLLKDQGGVLALTVLAVGWTGYQFYGLATGPSKESEAPVGGGSFPPGGVTQVR
jgi:hypothetical protein